MKAIAVRPQPGRLGLHGEKKPMNGTLLCFLLGVIAATAIFLPFVIVDKGFFTYIGDYNLQQIPFYMYLQQFIKSGGGTWSWSTDIGSSIVTGYSFYNLGSPFFWLSMIFPSRWMPFMMVPLFVVKFGCIAAAAHMFLKRYSKNANMAVVCSLLYAFCGFNIYNIFFNHMLEPVVIFPLMLWAMDSFVYDGKRGYFALTVGLALLNSYFFFAGNVVFIFLYFIIKLIMGEYRISFKNFSLLVLEAVLGVGIGMVIAMPSFLSVMNNPRTDSFASGWGLVLYGQVQQYFAIIASMFLPPDPPYLPNIFTEGAIKWTSMSAFLPVVSVAGLIAFWRSKSVKWLRVALVTSLVMAMVPILNSSFYAFNSSYYARWYYMPILLMCLATMYALERAGKALVKASNTAMLLTCAFIIFGLLPVKQDETWTFGVSQEPSKFWLTIFTALLGLLIFGVVVRFYRRGVRFGPILLACVMGFSIFYSVIHLSLGKFSQWSRDVNFRPEVYDSYDDINLPDDTFYRLDSWGTYDNLGLWFNRSFLATFNSTVTPSLYSFYPMVGVKRDVSSKPKAEHYALRGLLSVRYAVVAKRSINVPIEQLHASAEELGEYAAASTIPYDKLPVYFAPENLQMGWTDDENLTGSYRDEGWVFYDEQGPFVIFENENYVPMGFTYDSFIDMDNLWKAQESDRAPLLMSSIGLTREQIAKYGYLFDSEEGYSDRVGDEEDYNFTYTPVTYEGYLQDAEQRRYSSASSFTADSSGFTAEIYLQKQNLVFFSVPYDSGFTATVNGQAMPVLSVSGGMMAVEAPAGQNTIVFTYKTPGLQLGGSFTMLSLAGLLLYLAVLFYLKEKRRGTPAAKTAVGAGKKRGAQPERQIEARVMASAEATEITATETPKPDLPKEEESMEKGPDSE